ncbi:MAG TPA: JDVT-CTERM system CAAX-type protease [Gammaproteobacteria bacterium]|nr:JDVT-CTERM system CAAX-type protease [Gammaproteobacteria bacterium]
MLRDGWFHAALAAGAVVWLLLYLLYLPQPSWQGLVENAGRLLLLCVVYPVVEELAFRGWLQGWLRRFAAARRSLGGVSGANLLTSLLFVAAHFLYHPPAWAAAVFVPSLVFGWFRDRYQSVVPGILLHIIYNSGYFLLFLTQRLTS